jgi:hypothetical protein
MVSGAAALVAQLHGNDPIFAKKAVSNAAPVGQNLGAGRLDLMQALTYALTH